jgi:hypothetical protein
MERDRNTLLMKARIRKRKQQEDKSDAEQTVEYTAATSGLPQATLSALPGSSHLGLGALRTLAVDITREPAGCNTLQSCRGIARGMLT